MVENSNTLPIIVSAVVGLLTGVVGSLVAPWVNWGVEKRKLKRENRVRLIKELRTYLIKGNVQEKGFLNSENYINIRSFLSLELINDIENQNLVYGRIENHAYSQYNSKFLQELHDLEYKWGLGIGKRKNRKITLYNKDLGRAGMVTKRKSN